MLAPLRLDNNAGTLPPPLLQRVPSKYLAGASSGRVLTRRALQSRAADEIGSRLLA